MYELNINSKIVKYKLLDLRFMIEFNKKYQLEKDISELDNFIKLLIDEKYVVCDETLSDIEYDYLILFLLSNSDESVIETVFNCPYCDKSNQLDINLDTIIEGIKSRYFIPNKIIDVETGDKTYKFHINHYKKVTRKSSSVNNIIEKIECDDRVVIDDNEIKDEIMGMPIKVGKQLYKELKLYKLYEEKFVCTNPNCGKTSIANFQDITFFLTTLLNQE